MKVLNMAFFLMYYDLNTMFVLQFLPVSHDESFQNCLRDW